jgi:hypothetical protein
MNMSLRDWLENEWLTERRAGAGEIRDLLKAVERDLADAKIPALSADWRLNIAYNAALQAATAALAAAGYGASRERQHYRVIQSLAHTIEAEGSLIARFDRFRVKRNIGTYERSGMISDHEAEEMVELATEVCERVKAWMKKEHPDLMGT